MCYLIHDIGLERSTGHNNAAWTHSLRPLPIIGEHYAAAAIRMESKYWFLFDSRDIYMVIDIH